MPLTMSQTMSLALALLIGLCFLAGNSHAQVSDPAALVKAAVENEVRANDHPSDFWMYRLSKETKSGTQVRDMIETKDAIVARVISVNGKLLTPSERAADDKRLQDLLNNPAEQSRKRADQQKEQDRFMSLLKALPEGLLYTDDGFETIDGRETIRLKFRPNPAFHTTTRETIIFKAAEGHIWIDAAEKRIAKFDGTQTTDINIGWGLLGHINKGSKLYLEQRRLDVGKWRLSRLDLEGSGQILFFKSISLKQKQSATDFEPVPAGLSLSQGIDELKKRDNRANNSAR